MSIELTPFTIVPLPSKTRQRMYQDVVGEKDEHVVAAMAAKAAFLLILDKKLAGQANQANLPMTALSPGEFIKTVLPLHVDYPQNA